MSEGNRARGGQAPGGSKSARGNSHGTFIQQHVDADTSRSVFDGASVQFLVLSPPCLGRVPQVSATSSPFTETNKRQSSSNLLLPEKRVLCTLDFPVTGVLEADVSCFQSTVQIARGPERQRLAVGHGRGNGLPMHKRREAFDSGKIADANLRRLASSGGTHQRLIWSAPDETAINSTLFDKYISTNSVRLTPGRSSPTTVAVPTTSPSWEAEGRAVRHNALRTLTTAQRHITGQIPNLHLSPGSEGNPHNGTSAFLIDDSLRLQELSDGINRVISSGGLALASTQREPE
ncbi:hypothetical protein V8F33_009268 [Rhypophila sp. PSN 637]